jgi:hypothetical protein
MLTVLNLKKLKKEDYIYFEKKSLINNPTKIYVF